MTTVWQDLQYAYVLVVNVLDVVVYTAAMIGANTHHVSMIVEGEGKAIEK